MTSDIQFKYSVASRGPTIMPRCTRGAASRHTTAPAEIRRAKENLGTKRRWDVGLLSQLGEWAEKIVEFL